MDKTSKNGKIYTKHEKSKYLVLHSEYITGMKYYESHYYM